MNTLSSYQSEESVLPQRSYYFFEGYVWIFSVLVQTFSGICAIYFGNLSYIVTLFLYFLYFICLLFSLSQANVFSFSLSEFILFVFWVLSLLYTIAFFPENTPYIMLSAGVIPFCIMSFISGFLFEKVPNILDSLLTYSAISIFLSYLNYYVIISSQEIIKDMSFSYCVLPHVILLVEMSFRRRNIIICFLAFLGVVSLYLLATRGPLLILFIFFIYKILSSESRERKKKRISAVFLILFIFFFLYFYDTMDLLFRQLLLKHSSSNYMLKTYLEENTASIDERLDFYNEAFGFIRHNLLWGKGMFGDRVLLDGSYVHNVFFESFISFGLLGGCFFLSCFFSTVIRTLYRLKDQQKDFFVAVFFGFVLKYLFSGSILSDPAFFFFSGILFSFYNLSCHNDDSNTDKAISF